MAPQLRPGIPPTLYTQGGQHFEKVVLPLANSDYLDFFQSHGRKIASMYFKDYFCQGHHRGKKKKKKREKGTILNGSSHLSPLALGEVGASHPPWEFAAMDTAQQQAPSHASSTRQALGQLAGLPGARSLAGAAAWSLRACKYCSSRGSGINGCL